MRKLVIVCLFSMLCIMTSACAIKVADEIRKPSNSPSIRETSFPLYFDEFEFDNLKMLKQTKLSGFLKKKKAENSINRCRTVYKLVNSADNTKVYESQLDILSNSILHVCEKIRNLKKKKRNKKQKTKRKKFKHAKKNRNKNRGDKNQLYLKKKSTNQKNKTKKKKKHKKTQRQDRHKEKRTDSTKQVNSNENTIDANDKETTYLSDIIHFRKGNSKWNFLDLRNMLKAFP